MLRQRRPQRQRGRTFLGHSICCPAERLAKPGTVVQNGTQWQHPGFKVCTLQQPDDTLDSKRTFCTQPADTQPFLYLKIRFLIASLGKKDKTSAEKTTPLMWQMLQVHKTGSYSLGLWWLFKTMKCRFGKRKCVLVEDIEMVSQHKILIETLRLVWVGGVHSWCDGAVSLTMSDFECAQNKTSKHRQSSKAPSCGNCLSYFVRMPSEWIRILSFLLHRQSFQGIGSHTSKNTSSHRTIQFKKNKKRIQVTTLIKNLPLHWTELSHCRQAGFLIPDCDIFRSRKLDAQWTCSSQSLRTLKHTECCHMFNATQSFPAKAPHKY